MSRRSVSALAALALGASLLAAPVTAGAAPSNEASQPAPGPEVAESDTGSYVVVMEGDPLVISEGKDGVKSRRGRDRDRQMRSEHRRAADETDVEIVHDYTVALNGFSGLMSHDQAEALAARKDVQFVVPDEMRHATTDSSPDFLGLTGGNGAHRRGVTGDGVVVGVIDTGIWPEHPSFADDGSYPAAPGDIPSDLPCDFGNTAHNAEDAPFECNDKLLGARQMLDTYRAVVGATPEEFDSARDDDGHGTHTASTAAGNADVEASITPLGATATTGDDDDGDDDGDGDDGGHRDDAEGQHGRRGGGGHHDDDGDGTHHLGEVTGIAPRAHVIAYKGLGALGGFSSDLAAAIDQAVADGVDVINYSIGGGASLVGADDIAYLFAADAGVFVATSAGNSGDAAATIGGPASVPWLTTVGASTQRRFFEGTVRLGNGARHEGASLTAEVGTSPLVDAADATTDGDDLCVPGTLDPGMVSGSVVLCRRGAIARVDKSLAVQQAGGVGMILYENSDAGDRLTDTHYVPSVHVDNTPGLAIKSYIASTAEPTAAITDTGEKADFDPAPSMAQFSSRGENPVAADIIKPDVTAPGVQILAGASPYADPAGNLFQSIAGTSMSSPHVAGLFALLKQQHPDWSPAMAKSALMTTADQDVRDNDRVSPADPFDMGAGHVDVGSPRKKGSAFDPGLVYDAGFNEYLGFLCDAAPEALSPSTCPALEGAGVPTVATDLNLPSIGVSAVPGSKTVTRTVTSTASGNRKFKAKVDAPEGFEVTVSPSSIRLREGESASFTVTIENVSAPIGEWRHGSMTWKGGGYEVYSPISVKGALFDAPDAVSGSGESGSVAFDVAFGYTGEYTAAGHGLEPATVFQDQVGQDADQTFQPGDVATGGAVAHEITTSGSALLRLAIPPDAVENPDIDIDMFVLNSSGEQVASSTNGATDEQVDLVAPADDTYTVYVHGWQTLQEPGGGTTPVTLYAWDVSATPGGNLDVTGPASATQGEVATIEASWTGATAGQWHLGAVSHSDVGGLIGLTLVEVDNR